MSLFASESVVKKCSSAADAVQVEPAAAEDEDEEPRPQSSDSDIEPASEEEGPPVTDLGSGLQLLPTLEEQNQVKDNQHKLCASRFLKWIQIS